VDIIELECLDFKGVACLELKYNSEVYPNPGHREGSVRTKPSSVCQYLGSVRSQSKNFLDWTWTGRFRSGLIHCWTGGIIDNDLSNLGS
jgi:hypothetical protein